MASRSEQNVESTSFPLVLPDSGESKYMHFLRKNFTRQGVNTGRLKSPILPREKYVLLWIACLLIFVGWGLGGITLNSQWVILVLSAFSFMTLFLPSRILMGVQSRLDSRPRENLASLMRFPVFWFGLLFLIYIVIQGLNPAWKWVESKEYWWLQPIDHLTWLPSGMDTPFQDVNPFRMLIIMGSIWMMVCALWVGVKHRRALLFLFWIMCLNCAVVALVSVLLKLKNIEIPFVIGERERYLIGPFLYVNHAAAFFNLGITVALGLFFYYQQQTQRKLSPSSPHMVFLVLALVILVAVAFSLSVGGMTLAVVLILFFALVIIFLWLIRPKSHISPVLILLILGLIAGFSWTAYRTLDIDAIKREYHRSWNQVAQGDKDSRPILYEATHQMFKDNWLWGWGAGSYRFYFPVYQQEYPILWENRGKRLFWRYAHNDWLQYLVEYGVVGSSILALILFYCIENSLRLYRYLKPFQVILYFGCTLTLVHSIFDFILQSPSILVTLCFVAIGGLKFQALQGKRVKKYRPDLSGACLP